LYIAPRGELGQPVLLEFAHLIPSDVQGPDDLRDGLRLSVGDEAVAKLEHGLLIFGKLKKRLVERRLVTARPALWISTTCLTERPAAEAISLGVGSR
jgi:hypothetical protein